MSACRSTPASQARVNWLRISGISGSMSVHVVALLLLAIPIAVPSVRPTLPELSIRWIETPPEPVAVPVPNAPQPKPVPRTQARPVAVSSPKPEVTVDSVMAVPELPAINPIASAVEPAFDGDVAAAGGSDVKLAFESIVRPKYPIDARRRGEQGTVLLRVLVGRDGLPREVEIARSSGYRQLDRAAREALLRCRFTPVQVNGVAVQASGLVPIEFSIERG